VFRATNRSIQNYRIPGHGSVTGRDMITPELQRADFAIKFGHLVSITLNLWQEMFVANEYD